MHRLLHGDNEARVWCRAAMRAARLTIGASRPVRLLEPAMVEPRPDVAADAHPTRSERKACVMGPVHEKAATGRSGTPCIEDTGLSARRAVSLETSPHEPSHASVLR